MTGPWPRAGPRTGPSAGPRAGPRVGPRLRPKTESRLRPKTGPEPGLGPEPRPSPDGNDFIFGPCIILLSAHLAIRSIGLPFLEPLVNSPSIALGAKWLPTSPHHNQRPEAFKSFT